MPSNFSIVNSSKHLTPRLRNAVVAIGNFDGVHAGHQHLLSMALTAARQQDYPAIVMTFEPHPRSFFANTGFLFRLNTNYRKYKILELMGFDGVVEQSFSQEFLEMAPIDFIEQILIKDLNVKVVVIGKDFRFGKDRSGSSQTLKSYGEQHKNFTVMAVEEQKSATGNVISSSAIRRLLEQGQVAKVARLLNYHYTVESVVIHGAKLGRELGFPTINMSLPSYVRLAYGVYAVKLRRANGAVLNGVASFGKRPTVTEAGQILLETYLFNFNEEIYGEYVSVSFFEYLREEKKFPNLASLVTQIALDVESSRAILSKANPVSQLDTQLCF